MTRHLLLEEIIQAANRKLSAAEEVAHASACPRCRNKIAKYLAARAAATPAQPVSPGSRCPPVDRLERFAGGHKDPELAEHIEGCERCEWMVRDAREAGVGGPEEKYRTLALLFFTLAGVAAVLVAGWYFLVNKGGTPAAVTASAGVVARLENNEELAGMLARAYTETRPFECRLGDAGYSPARTGFASDKSGYMATAIRTIEQRLRANQNDLEATALGGRANLLTGHYQVAITQLTRAADVWPDDPTPRRDLGCAHAVRAGYEDRMADYEEAATRFHQVLEKQPNNAEAVFNLALVYEKLFRATEAAEQWRQFLTLNKDLGWQSEANRHLASLEKLTR